MAAVPSQFPVSVAEYWEAEQRTEGRLELVDGQIRAMAGGTVNHGTIAINIAARLYARLEGKPCRPFVENVRMAAEDDSSFLYPDVMVVCGPVERSESIKETVKNPKVVFEVLSPSTEAYDRGRKLKAYTSVPTLDAYVLVAQDRPAADVYTRLPDGTWRIEFIEGMDASLPLACLDTALILSEIYADVTFEPEQAV